ncbi:MAG: PQQ-binding-like beta-propeller repeat protein [Candidatus Brocadiaceae bacterium]|nr:PQQ-binding-like beta-propeller repeat protein [Candidatus Brocadiaceae bacterium]
MAGVGSRIARIALVGLSVGWLSIAAAAERGDTDWPRFRGPGGQGVSTAAGLPLKWSSTENVRWKTPLPGPGTSSPVVVGRRVFLTCYSGFGVPGLPTGTQEDLRLHVLCLDRDTGEILWNRTLQPRLPEQPGIREAHGYASSTPVADDERLYVYFGNSGVYAFDFQGEQLWHRDVGSKLHPWGSGASPILWQDLLIVNASIESGCAVALNRQSGQEVWRAQGIREAWNTPLVLTLPDGTSELVLAMQGKVVGLDPAGGRELWNCASDITWYIVPSVVAHEDVVWCLGGRSGTAAVAVRAGGRGDVTATHRLWTGARGSNVPSPIVHDGHLYWMHEGRGTAFCAEAATGRIVYEQAIRPRAGQVYASPVLADGRLFYLNRKGQTFVLAASPTFELLAVNDLADGSTFNASPAPSGDRLLLRSDRFLYCIAGD